jgi:hypothetical protein
MAESQKRKQTEKAITRQWYGKHISLATDTDAMTDDIVF